MHQPRLDAQVGKGGEVRLEEILELPLLLRIVEYMVGKAAVIMGVEDGFVEVFLLGVPASAAHILLLLPPDREEIGVSSLQVHPKPRGEQCAQTEERPETHCDPGVDPNHNLGEADIQRQAPIGGSKRPTDTELSGVLTNGKATRSYEKKRGWTGSLTLNEGQKDRKRTTGTEEEWKDAMTFLNGLNGQSLRRVGLSHGAPQEPARPPGGKGTGLLPAQTSESSWGGHCHTLRCLALSRSSIRPTHAG